jgi:hypothetical protein
MDSRESQDRLWLSVLPPPPYWWLNQHLKLSRQELYCLTYAPGPFICIYLILFSRVWLIFPRLASNLPSHCLCLVSSWKYRCGLPHTLLDSFFFVPEVNEGQFWPFPSMHRLFLAMACIIGVTNTLLHPHPRLKTLLRWQNIYYAPTAQVQTQVT